LAAAAKPLKEQVKRGVDELRNVSRFAFPPAIFL
jgi:hypothetical protein